MWESRLGGKARAGGREDAVGVGYDPGGVLLDLERFVGAHRLCAELTSDVGAVTETSLDSHPNHSP